MIYEALSTFGGLETPDAYRKGLAYNERIAEGERQEQLGWRDKLAYVPETQRVRVDAHRRAGAAVPGLVIAGEIGRPATDRFDRRLDAHARRRPARTRPTPRGLEPGWWTVDIEARKRRRRRRETLYRRGSGYGSSREGGARPRSAGASLSRPRRRAPSHVT